MTKKDMLQCIIALLILIVLFALLGYQNNKDVETCINNGVDVSICEELKRV